MSGLFVLTSLWREGVVPVQQGSPTLFEYSPRNLLTRVELPTTQRIDYSYDHLGNRVEQSVVGAQNPTYYLWDEFSQYGDVVLETGVNFTTSDFYRKMDYVLAGGMLVSQTNFSGNVQYFLSDAQGTTRSITDDMGVVTSEYRYDAFGNLDETIDPISIESTYLYTGQQFDPYTELYNLRARTYNPSNGRFLSRDTWAYNYQNPVELNRYGYSQNNPATYRDPSGNTSLITYAQRVTSSTVISAGLRGVVGGLANVLMEYLFAWIFQTEAQPLIAFGEGFVGGAAGYYAGNYTKAGKILSKFLELFVEFGVGVGFDVGARGENLGTSVLFNLGAGAVGLGFEQLGRKAAPYIVDAFPWLGRYFGIDPNSPNPPTGPTTPDSPNGSGISDSPNNTPNVGDTGGNGVNGDGHNGTTDGGNSGNVNRSGDGASANICVALNSFSADTTVETPDGDVPISEIEIGDIVIAYDEETGITGEYAVTDTISHEDDQIAYVTINGEEIETTPWHLFYTSEGWVEAGELEVGDAIVSLGGVYGLVDSVIIVDATQTMYDLTVEEVHTFAVGDGDWVVHNECHSYPEGIPVTPKGIRLANIADNAHASAFFPHTVAAVEVDGQVYITTNGGASTTIRNNIREFANANGYVYLDNTLIASNPNRNIVGNLPSNLPNDHAEVFMYHHFGDDLDIIGTSSATCPPSPTSCRNLFTEELGIQLVYNVFGR